MGADQRLPGKKDVARALLLKGSVFVHLDPRGDEVAVPQWLQDQPQLVLQVGLDMPIPIPDLRVDDHGVFGTLTFNRNPFTCEVPWEAVFAVVGDDGRGMVWPQSMPDEIVQEVERESRRAQFKLHSTDSPPPAVDEDDDGSGDDGYDDEQGIPKLASLEVVDMAEVDRALAIYDIGADEEVVERAPRRKVKLPPYLRVVK